MSIQEETISKVVDSTGCSKEEADSALELCNQNVNNAIKMINKKIVIIKGKLIIEHENLYGLFIIKIFLDTKFINPYFMLTRSDDIVSFNIENDILSYESIINEKFIFLDQYLQNLNKKLANSVSTNKKLNSVITELDWNIENKNKKISSIIRNIISDYFEMKNISIDVNEIIINQNEYERILKQRENIFALEQEIDNSKNENFDYDDIYIKIEPVLCENKNCKQSDEFMVGDDFFVKIPLISPQNSYIYNILSLNKDIFINNLFKTKVIEIKKSNSNDINFLLEFIPGIYSKISLDKNDSIRTKLDLTLQKNSGIILFIILSFIIMIILYYLIY